MRKAALIIVFLCPCGLRCLGENIWAEMVNSRANMLVRQKASRISIRVFVLMMSGSDNTAKTSTVAVN